MVVRIVIDDTAALILRLHTSFQHGYQGFKDGYSLVQGHNKADRLSNRIGSFDTVDGKIIKGRKTVAFKP